MTTGEGSEMSGTMTDETLEMLGRHGVSVERVAAMRSTRVEQEKYVSVCERARALGVDVAATDTSTMQELAERIDDLITSETSEAERETVQRLAADAWDLVPSAFTTTTKGER